MGLQCEYCGKITDDEDTVFCKYCGFRFGKTELDVLKNIEIRLIKNKKKADNSIKTQTRISYAGLIMAMIAFVIAIGAMLITVFSASVENRYVGLGIIVIVLFSCYYMVKKYAKPVDLDELDE